MGAVQALTDPDLATQLVARAANAARVPAPVLPGGAEGEGDGRDACGHFLPVSPGAQDFQGAAGGARPSLNSCGILAAVAGTNHYICAGGRARREPRDSGERMALPRQQPGYEPVQPIAFSHKLHAGEHADFVPVLPRRCGDEPLRGHPCAERLHELPQECDRRPRRPQQQSAAAVGVARAAQALRRAGPRQDVESRSRAASQRLSRGRKSIWCPTSCISIIARTSRRRCRASDVTVPSNRWTASGSSKPCRWGGA